MKEQVAPEVDAQLVSRLLEIADDDRRAEFIHRNPGLHHARVVEYLTKRVVQEVRVDQRQALRMADSALVLSDILRDERCLAQSLRAKANALYSAGENRAAVEHHAKSVNIWVSLHDEVEVARTLSSSLQPRALSGDYDGAMEAAERAREIFTRHGDQMRLVRLDINVGNILHRQDRFAEAIATWKRAYEKLLPFDDAEGIAVLLHNIAVCQISLNEFREAMQTYQRAREYAQGHNMPLLVAQADYNIAWLYSQRGEYSTAIDMLRACRESCRKNGDRYHFALCHMDLSEIYLELNLSEEAAQLSQEGSALFAQLAMGYEATKCTVNLAIALGQQGKTADEVVAAFVAKYGETALMAPPKRGFNWAAYLLPGIVITIVGIVIAAVLIRRSRVATVAAVAQEPDMAGLSPEEAARLKAELDRLES